MIFTDEQFALLQQALPTLSWDVDNDGQVIIYTDIWVNNE